MKNIFGLKEVFVLCALSVCGITKVYAYEYGPINDPKTYAIVNPYGYMALSNLFAYNPSMLTQWCKDEGFSGYSRMESAYLPVGGSSNSTINVAGYFDGSNYGAGIINGSDPAPVVTKIWCTL